MSHLLARRAGGAQRAVCGRRARRELSRHRQPRCLCQWWCRPGLASRLRTTGMGDTVLRAADSGWTEADGGQAPPAHARKCTRPSHNERSWTASACGRQRDAYGTTGPDMAGTYTQGDANCPAGVTRLDPGVYAIRYTRHAEARRGDRAAMAGPVRGAAGQPGVSAGWHAREPDWRWTDGDASLATGAAREAAFTVVITGTYWREEKCAEARIA